MQHNYYGSQQPNTGFMDQVYSWGKQWIANAPMNVNRQLIHGWLESKGVTQLCTKMTAALGYQPDMNQACNFIMNEMTQAAIQLGAMAPQQMQQQQSMQQGFAMTNANMVTNTGNSYAGVVSHQTQPEPTQQPKEVTQQPKVEEVKKMKSFNPKELNSEPYEAPGLTGSLKFYENEEDRFAHLKCSSDIAFANRDELISYLRDNKPAGNCIIEIQHIEYMRFNIPSDKFQAVIGDLKNLMSSSGIRNMTDYELIKAFNGCLADIPKGMTDRLEGVIVELANRYITNKALQSMSNINSFIQIDEFSDIKEFLTNTNGLAKLKETSGYKSRIKAMIFDILRRLSEAILDTGLEFGAESPWLGLCGNLKLPNEDKLVKEVYLSPDRDAINVQKDLAKEYTIIGMPKTTFVSFGTLNNKSNSTFVTLTNRRSCSVVPQPRDAIEYIVGKEASSIEPVEIIIVDPLYPIPQIFVHGMTLDPVAVVVRW